MRSNLLVFIIVFTTFLSGCGGGGSESKTPVTETPPKQFTITATSSEGGSVSPESISVEENKTSAFTLTADENYIIDSVTGCDGSLTNDIYTIGAANRNCSVTANYKLMTYSVTATAEQGGSISPAELTITHGETASFTLTPDANYVVDTVSGCNGSLTDDSYTTGAITAACEVTASFKLTNYLVIATAEQGGTITPTEQTITHGETASFTLTPDANYVVDTVSGCDGLLTDNAYTTGAITAACEVTASFKLTNYVVTATAEQGGTITPTEQTITHGDTTQFTVMENTGYSIDSVAGCNGILTDNIYTTSQIFSGCGVNVSFKVNANEANLTLISLNAYSESEVEVVWLVNFEQIDFQNTEFKVYLSESPITEVTTLTPKTIEIGKYQTLVKNLQPSTQYYVVVTVGTGVNTVVSDMGSIKTANVPAVTTQTKSSDQIELGLMAESVEPNVIVFDKTDQSTNPEIGQIIYNADIEDMAQQKNYFRKVKSITDNNNKLEVETESATVSDLFTKAEFNSQFTLFDPISEDSQVTQNFADHLLSKTKNMAYHSNLQIKGDTLERRVLMKQAGLLVVETQYAANSPKIKKQIEYNKKVELAKYSDSSKSKNYKADTRQQANGATNDYVTVSDMPELLTGRYNQTITFSPKVTLKNIYYDIKEVTLTLSHSNVDEIEDNYGATFTLIKTEQTQKVGKFTWTPKEAHAITQGENYKAKLTVTLKESGDCSVFCEKTVTQTTEVLLTELNEQRDGDLKVHLPTISEGRVGQPKEIEFTINLASDALADDVKITDYKITGFALNEQEFDKPALVPEYSEQITALPNGKIIWTPTETQLTAFKKIIDETGEVQPFALTLKVNAEDKSCSDFTDWCNTYEAEITAELYIAIDLKLDSGTQTIPIYEQGGMKLAVDYNIGFKPTLDVGVDISGGEIDSAKLILAGQFDFSLKAYAELNKSFTKEYKTGDMSKKDANGDPLFNRPPLFKKQYYKVYSIAGVPVIQQIDFEVNAKITFVANAAVTMEKSYTYNKYFKTGLTFDGNNWQKINENGTSSSLSFEIKAAADATFTVELVPQISTTFYEVATAGLALEPELIASLGINGIFQSDENTQDNFYDYRLNDATVKYNVAVTGWLDLSFFKNSIYHYPENINERATIWQYPLPGNTEQETNATLFSLPSLAINHDKPQGASVGLTVDMTDGRYAFSNSKEKNNAFIPNANPWKVFKINYNNGETGTNDKLIPVASVEKNQQQAIFTGEIGNFYTIYFTGNDSIIGSIARNYIPIELDYTDNDHDGLPLIWETQYCLPYNSGANDDPDNDGLINIKEYQLGTLPNSCVENSNASQDSDNDGMPDGWEVKYGLNPLENDANGDPDNDSISNLAEYTAGTTPTPERTDLSSITITGDSSIDANSSATYTLTANYSDGSNALIDGLWQLPTNNAVSVSNMGVVSVGNLSEDTTIEITAEAQGLQKSKVITLKAPLPNSPPTANAGSDQSVNQNSTVTLDGSASTDTEDDANNILLTYSWIQTDSTGATVTLNESSAIKPTFTAPTVTETTTLEFTLTVTDSQLLMATDTVEVMVEPNTNESNSLNMHTDTQGVVVLRGKDQEGLTTTIILYIDGSTNVAWEYHEEVKDDNTGEITVGSSGPDLVEWDIVGDSLFTFQNTLEIETNSGVFSEGSEVTLRLNNEEKAMKIVSVDEQMERYSTRVLASDLVGFSIVVSGASEDFIFDITSATEVRVQSIQNPEDDNVYNWQWDNNFLIDTGDGNWGGGVYSERFDIKVGELLVSDHLTVTGISVKAPLKTSVKALNIVDINLAQCVDEKIEENGYLAIEQITTLDCSNLSITDAKGIEQLTALVNLNLSDNLLTEIDLSSNVNITTLNLDNNQLATIDFTNNTLLQSVSLLNNTFTQEALDYLAGINWIESLTYQNEEELPPLLSFASTAVNSVQITWSAQVGNIASYLITQDSGVNVDHQLTNIDLATGLTLTFVLPEITEEIILEFTVTVTDEAGTSTTRSISLTITPTGTPSTTANGKLNDTGITSCSNASENGLACPVVDFANQDAENGRDAQAAAGTLTKVGTGHAGFDFTKLDDNGHGLAASASEWSCVQDNVTGLTWEVKTLAGGGGIHDASTTYRWGGKGADPYGTGFYPDWDVLVDGSNTDALCNFSDWRVPTVIELQGLVSYDRVNPAIDTDYFPNTVSSHFWSASAYANFSSNAWFVNFSDGGVNYFNRGNHFIQVRLVRGEQ